MSWLGWLLVFAACWSVVGWSMGKLADALDHADVGGDQ